MASDLHLSEGREHRTKPRSGRGVRPRPFTAEGPGPSRVGRHRDREPPRSGAAEPVGGPGGAPPHAPSSAPMTILRPEIRTETFFLSDQCFR
ncbi:MAG: hypothetical protein AVDCRST_MAG02-3860 [uncultured Rubrobacteraceae bacterium]|uniref:Uncharacterized protein n=1 Tax=uncultured Rubrobacteraceae bacterium TaxID=349277 RepID=A0A6J4RFT4_9ACTN|nr:MAG: hypothetical protein AVDCRST_MAG02-3860 [uncultured Rubrobacteraceae bacterium]